MYPDWPRSEADLVPLPADCDGPKLKPFDFQGGPQQIEFVELLGEGAHAYVFKVKMQGREYALKVFRFVNPVDWVGIPKVKGNGGLQGESAFYPYAEPFSCECRAYGRLHETRYEHLAVRSFGYVLLDEQQEQAMMDKFDSESGLWFGSCDNVDDLDMRADYPGRNGRPPPLRAIVKELGRKDKLLGLRLIKKIQTATTRLQQLGIIGLDVCLPQIVDGKLSDFSTAVTTPHFLTNPELNPRLTPGWIARMEHEAFRASLADYAALDIMVNQWDYDAERHPRAGRPWPGPPIPLDKFPGATALRRGAGAAAARGLRRRAHGPGHDDDRPFTYVDPRRRRWTTFGQPSRKAGLSFRRPALQARPPLWYLECDAQVAKDLSHMSSLMDPMLHWEYRDGLIFPTEKAEGW